MPATLITPPRSPSLFLRRGRERPGVLGGGERSEQRGRAANAMVRNVALDVPFGTARPGNARQAARGAIRPSRILN